MQQRTVISNGKRLLVNVATNDDGIGAGFSVGQLVMKSATNGNWYVVTTSGSAPASLYVSQSALPFTATGPAWTQGEATASYTMTTTFFEQNYPYQLVASSDGNAYAVYLTGNEPNVVVTVSQSAWGKAFITSSDNAVIALAKPYLLLQNMTDGNYYTAQLATSLGTTTISVVQTCISQSWIHPIY